MAWFAENIDALEGWQFYLMPILVLLNYAGMAELLPAITASRLCLLPRVMPAPQGLLQPGRPSSVKQTPVTTIYDIDDSRQSQLSLFPSLLHHGNNLKPFSFLVYKIESSQAQKNPKAPPIKPSWLVKLFNILACLISCGLLALCIFTKDGVGILAVSLLSITSSITGYASMWLVPLRPRPFGGGQRNNVCKIICTPIKAIIVVHCDAAIATALFSGSWECQYNVTKSKYRILVILAGMVLMVSLVLLSNCRWPTHLAVGSAYILLNMMSWALTTATEKLWMFGYNCKQYYPPNSSDADRFKPDLQPTETDPSLARTLWYAIRETRSITWVPKALTVEIGIQADNWRPWLAAALENIEKDNWPAAGEARRLVYGETHVYDRPPAPEQPASADSRRDASLEIRSIPLSKW